MQYDEVQYTKGDVLQALKQIDDLIEPHKLTIRSGHNAYPQINDSDYMKDLVDKGREYCIEMHRLAGDAGLGKEVFQALQMDDRYPIIYAMALKEEYGEDVVQEAISTYMTDLSSIYSKAMHALYDSGQTKAGGQVEAIAKGALNVASSIAGYIESEYIKDTSKTVSDFVRRTMDQYHAMEESLKASAIRTDGMMSQSGTRPDESEEIMSYFKT